MVSPISGLSRNGVSDWLVQRLSAVIIGVYFVVVLGFWLLNEPLTYYDWHYFMTSSVMKYFSLLTLFAILAHALIGLWTIATDYIKPIVPRLMFQIT